MKILINTRNIKIIEKEKIYTGNVNTYIINVEYEDYNFFSEYNCYLTFKNNDLKKKVIIGPDLKVIIPFDVLSETGNLIIGFFAIKVDEKEKLIRYSSEIEVLPVEKGGFDEEASEPEELTPTILEKYLQEMKNFYNESLEGYNTNAINKTEEFNKNYGNKVNSFNNNATQKLKEYNENADKREEEINNKVSDIEKIEDNIEQIQKNVQASEQNAKTSETNAKTSEINAQKSAENASEVLTNVTTIQEDINKSKVEINTAKESVDKSVEKVYSAVTEATNQAKESEKQAGIATSKANQTSTDKSAVETMKNEVSSMKTSIEQIKTDTQAIKDDVETAKNETLQAKEEVENSLENERKISDNKYARALKTQLEDIEQIQIYAENPEVEELKIKGAELTQKTRKGYNQLKNTGVSRNYNGIDFIVNSDGTVLANGTATGGTSGSSISQINIHDEEIQFEAGDYTIQDCKAYVVYEDDSYEWFDGLTKATSKTFDKSFKITDVYIQVNPEITVNNKLYYPMILKGTENKPYEEYGASPSLDYPSEIQVAKEQNISIEGKNKCRGWMNTTSTAVYGSAFLIKADLKPNTKYTISLLTPSFKAEYYRAEELTSNWFTVINNGKRQSYTFTTKADISNAYKEYNGEYGYILFKNAIATPSPANFSDVMLVEGDTDVPYEPYYGHDVNIPLTNNSIGNYFDVIDRENKVQDKVIQELILTGNENYNFNNVENGIYQYSIAPAKKPIYINDSIIRAMSNYFKGVGRNGSWNIDNSITTNMSNIRFMTSQYTTVEEFKAKIKELYEAGKPVKIYYVSETIDKIPLSEEVKQELDKFKLYDGLNNVSIDNGTLSFKYNKSLLKVLEEKDEKIDDLQSQIDEIKTLLSTTSTASLLLENLANDNESEVS